MSEEAMIRNCSPTLAGIKTGNLFRCTYESAAEMREAVRYWNRQLGKKGVRILPLRYQAPHALMYVYRPAHLSADLQDASADAILRRCGYTAKTSEHCIVELMQRLKNDTEFPHEIGLFLGYPPEDVSGFMEQKACGYKCVGCWKVYGDEAAAQKTFEKYRKCSEVYRRHFENGTSIDRLTVSQ